MSRPSARVAFELPIQPHQAQAKAPRRIPEGVSRAALGLFRYRNRSADLVTCSRDPVVALLLKEIRNPYPASPLPAVFSSTESARAPLISACSSFCGGSSLRAPRLGHCLLQAGAAGIEFRREPFARLVRHVLPSDQDPGVLVVR